jgi:hypothetical protein
VGEKDENKPGKITRRRRITDKDKVQERGRTGRNKTYNA